MAKKDASSAAEVEIEDEDDGLIVLDQTALAERLHQLHSLPPKAQNEAILQELATLTFNIQNAINQLRLKSQEDLAKAQRENRRIRRRVAGTITASVCTALLLTTFANNIAIKHCFLGSSTGKHSAVCNTLFPGYNNSVDRQNALLQQFNDLLATIPQNKARIDEIQREIEELQKQRGH